MPKKPKAPMTPEVRKMHEELVVVMGGEEVVLTPLEPEEVTPEVTREEVVYPSTASISEHSPGTTRVDY